MIVFNKKYVHLFPHTSKGCYKKCSDSETSRPFGKLIQIDQPTDRQTDKRSKEIRHPIILARFAVHIRLM